MIYEITTYDLKPRAVPKTEAMFEAAYAARQKHSELIGAFHTEFGPLNQIVHIWRYDDLAQQERVAKAVAREGTWPPPIGDWLLGLRTEIVAPVWFSPELKPGDLGPYFEMRTYTYPMGGLEKMMSVWERAMPMRDALGSPVAAIWSTQIGVLNSLVQIWPYRSLVEREEIRRQVRIGGKWPPYLLDLAEGGPGYDVLSQENKILRPARFSPLQ